MTKIEMGRFYRTRDGREVRIYAVDGGGDQPVHGAINLDGEWECLVWRMDGRLSEYIETDTDLIEVKPRIKREVWVNVYRGRESQYYEIYDEYDDALEHHTKDTCIACKKITIDCDEGEGL